MKKLTVNKEESKQKICQIKQDFNNEEILTKNVEGNQKSCQILERVMIFWVKKLTVNKEESKQKICQIKQDFNNEEILTKNVEGNQKSCQILERVMIFWVKKIDSKQVR